MKRIISALLLCAIAASTLACGGESGAPVTSDTTSASGDTTTEESFDYADLGGFSLDVAKLDQTKIAWSNNTFDPEEQNGEILNDTIFKRNSYIEQMMNCTINETTFESLVDVARQNILADDDSYDLYMDKLRDMAALTAEDLFCEIHEIDTLDLTKPYWDQDFLEDTSVLGKNYMLVGELLVTTADCLYAIIYNKGLAEDYEITDLYSIVRDGKWTFDKMLELCTLVSGDLNGDAVIDQNDRFGMIAQSAADPIFGFIIGSGLTSFTLDTDGKPVFAAENDKFHEVVSKLSNFFGGDMCVDPYGYKGLATRDAIGAMFGGDQGLFLTQCISAAGQYLRGVEQDFGFLPMPKYDEAQEFYLSHVNMGAPVFFVPKTNKELSKTGSVLEALCHYSTVTLTPAFYESCFSAKYTRDEESYEMLKLALEHNVYELGFIWKWGDFTTAVTQSVMSESDIYMSTVASVKPLVLEAIDKTLASLSEVE